MFGDAELEAWVHVETWPKVIVAFIGEHGGFYEVRFAIGPVTRIDLLDPVVPSVPDALHLAALLIDAVDAKLRGIARLDMEENTDLHDQAPDRFNSTSISDHFRMRTGLPEIGHSPENNFEARDNSKSTPLDTFNLAAELVRFLRPQLPGRPLEAKVFACRHKHHDAVAIVIQESGAAQDKGQPWRVFLVSNGDTKTEAPIVRPVSTCAEGIHVAGLVLDALGIEHIALGWHRLEINSDLLLVPMALTKAGARARADHQRHAMFRA